MEFANWAFMTPEARTEAKRGRMAVNAALKATKCTKALCEYALTSRLPEEITVEESHCPGTSDPAPLQRAGPNVQLETPALHTRTQQAVGTVSSCEDPPIGWTVSNHGGPQRAFLSVPTQAGLQENTPPSPDRRPHLAAKDIPLSSPDVFASRQRQECHHNVFPYASNAAMERPDDTLRGGATSSWCVSVSQESPLLNHMCHALSRDRRSTQLFWGQGFVG